MSNMPAKKKSCFQITSVTQAQVAAIGAADDTESLDDPDESRTEDVSSEIYDMSRAEYEPVCDRSSSEEALNNVGEPEAISVIAPSHIPQAGQLPALSGNVAGEFRKVGVSASTQGGQQPAGIGAAAGGAPIPQPGALQQQPAPAASVSVNTSQPAAVTSPAPPPTTSTVSCTSRFRVIKLDHGTGEPFRRGRWTCTEFYEKDSESSAVGRTADSIRHVNNSATTLDPAADRDSGLGHTGGSVVPPASHSGQGLGSVADASLSSRMHSVETQQQQQQQIQHQNYNDGMHPSAHPVVYPAQQHPMGHHLTGQSSGLPQNPTEFYQQQQPPSMQPGPLTGQPVPVSSLSGGPQPMGQDSVLPASSAGASVPSHVGDVTGGGSIASGQPGLLQQQTGGIGGVVLVSGSTLQQQAVSQYTAAGQPQPHGLHPVSSGVQNVPAIAASSSVPTAVPSAPSAAMPNVTSSSMPQGQVAYSRTQGALGMQGLGATGFGLVEGAGGVRGRFEGLFNTQSPVVFGREAARPLNPESLQLATPTVNSLFGIHIPVDGDVDRASGTNVAAIDNKIEQAMDLVKSHLMYAVREEVEVLKEQIKELFERNSLLEKENAVLKSLANSEQLSQLPAQPAPNSSTTPPQQGLSQPQQQPPLQVQPQQPHPQPQLHPKPQPLQTPLDPSQPQPNVTSA
ncbi:TSC22 domain family protein 2-like [Gymnodraco acuticeps]|uniref:TSC22 domain family protein 2-like n=1 Tax=Gymnodraco acuticeps TaxID=8218 RepID=A0A6P8U3H5_GYMAC|nr:TSC22 domain family protein 2-like [Gymnodraco acuticeps]